MKTTCPYCGVGCGLSVNGRAITGDQSHPANHGKLCVKGANLAPTLDDTARLMHPVIGGSIAGWDEALDLIAAKFASTIAQYGPDSVAIYGSGQFLTEDYYVANKLMKGFIGSANIDTNSRLCMASTVAGHIRAFGEDVVPGTYDDIDQAELLVFVGANAAWCHPVLFERALAARIARGTKIVVIDPRKTATAALADLHLPLRPDGDIALFQQLLSHLAATGGIDASYVAAHTEGFIEALALAQTNHDDLGIDAASLTTFFTWFAKTPRTVTLFSQGVNQSVTGTDKVNAIINVHLATGRIGKPGMGPFSLTGQPNAMGGREVGGLANQLAAHLQFDDAADRALLTEFWAAPNLAKQPGLKAIEMFDAVLSGKIKAIWIAATNPAESLPRSERIRAALEACPFVVVADCWPTETTRLANVILPAAGWSEKDGTVTNSERTISRQRAFRAAPGAAKPDWWMFAEIGKRLGHAPAFSYTSSAEIFREHAALSGHKNNGARLFDISRLAYLSDEDYDALNPVQWPQPQNAPPQARLFANGGFATPDKKARFITVAAPAPTQPVASFPFILNTGRLRDQWHTMTRTGFVPALMASAGAANFAISPIDAERLKITEGDLLRLTTRHGSAILPAAITTGQRRGEIFAAMHWTRAHSNAGTVSRLIGPARDPHSGQPGMKQEPVAVQVLPTLWHGILQSRVCPIPAGQFVSARIPLPGGLHRVALAGWKTLPPANDISDWGAKICGADADDERIEMSDPARSLYRLGIMRAGRLIACLFIARSPAGLPQPGALSALFVTRDINRIAILRGGTATGIPAGRVICVCHNVTETTIRSAIKANNLTTIAGIGVACKAGTNCGSCKGELAEFLTHQPELVS